MKAAYRLYTANSVVVENVYVYFCCVLQEELHHFSLLSTERDSQANSIYRRLNPRAPPPLRLDPMEVFNKMFSFLPSQNGGFHKKPM